MFCRGEFLSSEPFSEGQESNHSFLSEDRDDELLVVFAEETHPRLSGPGAIGMFNASYRSVDFDRSTNSLRVNTLRVHNFKLSRIAFEQYHPFGDEHLPHDGQEHSAKDKLEVDG